MKIKICGITNLEDALDAIEAGADAIGFVFYKKSPRYIEAKEARKIVKKLPPFIQTVGLFVNETAENINKICDEALINLAQVYDDNSLIEYEKLRTKYIKVLRAKSKDDILKNANEYILVDAFVEEFGGAGKRVALQWFDNVDCSKFILAGGLNEKNLKELKGYNFFGVDVSSGVEISKGKKDKQKMFNFVKAANEI
ncbi:phosphoribosylanthranilate isomerase [Halarcobacter anaerophilus]|uniref:N-(5'-phosphoribosyl)anthranilate isomerase n=1 Tax=Halarcobacter anaerophilus TaxID=877500 RepID=A0A4Q0Y6Y9_9BACT|nr:phosphoribosylanthranilate isomerase [Halarcobacter anaerophilus]QDF29414.1 phosphoribosylanthranilate isomerase [Halarcobacter anaerophilus]RXJ64659.1 N-(5'-phosphoribosyl)anthranilate isomerase [Halarcobacter anaerophilus]